MNTRIVLIRLSRSLKKKIKVEGVVGELWEKWSGWSGYDQDVCHVYMKLSKSNILNQKIFHSLPKAAF